MNLEEFKAKNPYVSHVKNYKIIGNPKAMHLIYNFGTFRIVAFSPWITTVNTLNEVNINTVAKYWQNYPRYKILPEGCTTEKAWLCKWDESLGRWLMSEEDFTEEELYSFVLHVEKAAVLDEIYQRILHYRRPVMNTLNMQDAIYQMKYDEAIEIKNSANPIEDPWQWPLVNDYANLQGVTLKDAAEEIIFQNKIFKSRLSNTETIRIKYTRAVKHCNNILELDKIINQFYTEGEIYGQL